MKLLISIVFIGIVLFSLNAKSQTSMGANNSADYLMITKEQQEIYLRRFLEANSEIAAQCQSGWSIDQSNQYFVEWVKNNPQFLRRNLTSSFTAALLSACKMPEKK
jgi:hypothetical protein